MKKARVIILFVSILGLFFYNFYFRPINGNSSIDENYKNSDLYVNGLYRSDENFKKCLLSDSEYHLYYEVINGVKEGKTVIRLSCGEQCDNFDMIYEAVLLDHPELITFLGGGWSTSNGGLNFFPHYNINKYFAYFAVRRIEREMENIRKDTEGMSDQEKILYVYDYVGSRDYDFGFMYSDFNQSSYSFFTTGTSVCAGFAKAAQIIFQNIGIKSYLIHGSNHMWNYVEYEGNYYIFDATVGASVYESASSLKKDKNLFYAGLYRTTVGVTEGEHMQCYPKLADGSLQQLFDK